MALALDTRLGPYAIGAQIGVGGMGEVYRAKDTDLGRDVAIKVLPEAFAQDPERLARFEREAKTLASLNHPNIAIIHGLERAGGGVLAIVMELVEGPTLADRIEQGPIPVDEALPIAQQIAEALEAAHEQGIIHRDLKPANIKLRPDGTVKVLDFGLAKALEPAGLLSSSQSMSPTITTPAMTQMGMILGTAAYMSPEQAKGKPADKRSDVWAYGCVLFEMVTGRRAFEGEDISDTLAAVLRGEPDWTALPAIAPPEIRTLVEGCLTKDRKERIASISTVRFLLDKRRVLAVAAPAPFRTRPRWKQVLVVTFVAAIVAAISAIVSWAVKPSPIQTVLAVTRFSIPLGENQELTNLGRRAVAISPDGTQVVYVANNRLYLRSMSELEARPIPGTENLRGVTSPAFSPDGRSIVFGSGADRTLTLKRIAVSGGTPLEICQTDALFGVTWGQDGILFGQGPQGIMRVPPEGGRPELLVGVKDGELASDPQALPDGRGALFTIASGRLALGRDLWNTARIVVHTSNGSESQTLIEGGADARYLSSGHIVYAVEGRLIAASFELRDLKVTSKPVPVLEGIARGGPTGATQFSVANNGSLAYIPGPPSRSGLPQFSLATVDRTGKTELLKLPPGVYQSPRVSTDGKQIALGITDDKEADIWIYDLPGTSAMRRLTFGKSDRLPVWSADGQYVAFQSEREGDRAIFLQRADFSGTAERLTKPQAGTSHIPESWSSQGNVLTYSVFSDSTRRYSLASLSIETKESHSFGALTSTVLPASDFSPDGRWLAYNVSDTFVGTARSTVFVEPFPPTSTKYQISETRNGFHPKWLPDGKQLTYSTGVGPDGPQWVVVNITMQPRFTIGGEVRVSNGGLIDSLGPGLNFPGAVNARNYDFTPVGRRIGIIPVRDDVSSSPSKRQHIQVVLNWLEELKRLVPTK